MAEGADLVQRTNGSLAQLIRGTGENAVTVAEIAAAMRSQSADLGELTNRLRQVEEAARSGAEVAEESAGMSAGLRSDAMAMLASADAFRDANGWAAAEQTQEAEALQAQVAWAGGVSGPGPAVEDYMGEEPGTLRNWGAAFGLPPRSRG